MKPSQGTPGVILEGRECQRARIALEAYPLEGHVCDPQIERALRRMTFMEDTFGRVTEFVLPASLATKLSENISERADANLPTTLSTLPVFVPEVNIRNIYYLARSARAKQFASRLAKYSAISLQIAHEQIPAPR